MKFIGSVTKWSYDTLDRNGSTVLSAVRQFGRYLITDESQDLLGRGGFGRVYRAYDPNLKKYVAIKVLYSASDGELLKRFEDECRTTGNLEHENIVKVHNFDQQDGIPYLVMELLDGEPLDSLIKSGKLAGKPIPLLSKLDILLQTAKGLAYAHSLNVIHRDVKPGNVMVMPNGRVKIMDFGIARVVDKDGTRRTRQGDIAGTILYMAPEQFQEHDADKRTDIFAFGCVCYEFLAGFHPFNANDVGAVIYNITTVEPRPIREALPECPEELDDIVQRLIVKDPELRTNRLADVVLDMQPILQLLRQQRADSLASEIQPLMERGERHSVHAAIQSVLELDPFNVTARKYRDRLREEDRSNLVEALVRQGRQNLASRKFDDADRCFERAFALDKNHPEIRGLLEQSRSTGEKVRNGLRLLGQARAAAESGQLERALDLASGSVELDPGSEQAQAVLNDIREMLRVENENRVLPEIADLGNQGRHADALAALDRFEVESGGSDKITELRAVLETGLAEFTRRERLRQFEEGLDNARAALRDHRLEDAEQLAQRLSAEYPDEPLAQDFQMEVREYQAARRRIEGVREVTRKARELIAEKRFEEAQELLANGSESFPGDTKIERLMDMAAALGQAQKRVLAITQAVSRAGSLCDEEQWEAAARVTEQAIAEFGEQQGLLEARMRVETALKQRAQAEALQRVLEEARALLADRPNEAVAKLAAAESAIRKEPEVANLLTSARDAAAAAEEREEVSKALSRIAPLEAKEDFDAACQIVEEGLRRYPGSAPLLAAAEGIHQKMRRQEQARQLAVEIAGLEETIAAGDWEKAATDWRVAAQSFPEESALVGLYERIQDGRRKAEIEQLRSHVEGCFAQQDLAEAESRLSAARAAYSEETPWKVLWSELQRRKTYEATLLAAQQDMDRGEFEKVEETLRAVAAAALDERAPKLLASARQRRQAAEERLLREVRERAQRDAEEKARREREDALAKARVEAEKMSVQGDYQGAIDILNAISLEYPGDPEVARDHSANLDALERQFREQEERTQRELEQRARREAGEKATLERERTISRARVEAAEKSAQGDYRAAIKILDSAALRYPGDPDVTRDREAALAACQRQLEEVGERTRRDLEEKARRDAAEQARLEREHGISAARKEAAGKAAQGDFRGAIRILDSAALQYLGDPDIVRDREALIRGLEHQIRELEQQSRRDLEERARRDAEARARLEREGAVARARSEAAERMARGDNEGAIRALDAVELRYHGDPDIARDRETALTALERQIRDQQERTRRELEERVRRDAEEQTRVEREDAIAAARGEAAEKSAQGDHEGAVRLLDALRLRYPGDPGIAHDRETALRALERQVREKQERTRRELQERASRVAEEKARLEREQTIARARSDAARKNAQGDHRGALLILEPMALRYPDEPALAQEREETLHSLELQIHQQEEKIRREREEKARQEAEEKARLQRALDLFSKRQRPPDENAGSGRQAMPASQEGANEETDSITQVFQLPAQPLDTKPGEDAASETERNSRAAEERARAALAAAFAKKPVSRETPLRRLETAIGAAAAFVRPWIARNPARFAVVAAAVVAGLMLLGYLVFHQSLVEVTAAPARLEFRQAAGQLPASQHVELSIKDLDFGVTATAPWISAWRADAGIIVAINDGKLQPGRHEGGVRIDLHSKGVSNPLLNVPVVLIVSPSISATPSKLEFHHREGDSPPRPRQITVQGSDGFSVGTDETWLRASSKGGIVKVSINTSGLAAGQYSGHLILKDSQGLECQVPVSLTVAPGNGQ